MKEITEKQQWAYYLKVMRNVDSFTIFLAQDKIQDLKKTYGPCYQ